MMQHNQIKLRKTQESDLEFLFQFQLNQEANYLAAFTPKDPTVKTAYFEKYTKHINDPTINMQTILVDGTIIGSIAKFEMKGVPIGLTENSGEKASRQQHLKAF